MVRRRPIGKGIQRGFGLSVLVAVGTVVAWTYRLLFSGLDEHSYQRGRRKFIAEIERSFSYLFSAHGGSVHPSKGEDLPRAFDYVSATVEFNEMNVQLIRGRGELDVRLAPPFDPEEWRPSGFYWQLLDLPEGNQSLGAETSLEQVAWRLQANWDRLVALFSDENWFPSLTNAEWHRFLKLPRDEKQAVRASMAPRSQKQNKSSDITRGNS